ncbi:MAG: hypothetical protein M3Z26_08375 [Bacteroidota bacterium]|nr:hypothetical protein [Bacteroidota bacterium]
MNSLFKAKFDWGVYLVAAIAVRILFFDITWFSYAAILIALYQFLLFFYSIGYVIPLRYLAGSLMCLQMLIGPALAYNGLDQYQRGYLKMQIPEFEYFSYAIPAMVCFILGLHITAGNLKGEFVNEQKIKDFVTQNETIPYWFVGIGFLSSVIAPFFSTELAFVFVLLGSFKFIGVFLIILGSKQLKPIYLVLVYTSIIVSSLRGAMFHDLLTWLIFLGAVFAIKYKPTLNTKALFIGGFVLLAIVIQQLKGDYRKTLESGNSGGIEVFNKTYEENQQEGKIFNSASLGASNIRINQGFIVTNIMQTVPDKVPFENGSELMRILEAAILPRILAPNKLNAGDQEIFKKYSGMPLQRGTSMGLSSMGDGYINFGVFGGCIFMFFYGLLFSEVLNVFYKNSFTYPVLILFIPLVFYYPIRPDCELQTILGHIVKSCFLIFVMIQVWKVKFRVRRLEGAAGKPSKAPINEIAPAQ